MGVKESFIILTTFILVCTLGYFYIGSVIALNHLQQLDYYLWVKDTKNHLNHLIETICVTVMGCVLCTLYVLHEHISQCTRNPLVRIPMYDLLQVFSSAMAAVLIYLLGTFLKKLNNLLTVSFYEIRNNVYLWKTDVNNSLCQLVTCTSCLIIVCIGCIVLSQRPRIRGNN